MALDDHAHEVPDGRVQPLLGQSFIRSLVTATAQAPATQTNHGHGVDLSIGVGLVDVVVISVCFVVVDVVVIIVVVDVGDHYRSHIEHAQEEGDQLECVHLGISTQITLATFGITWEPDYWRLGGGGLDKYGFGVFIFVI